MNPSRVWPAARAKDTENKGLLNVRNHAGMWRLPKEGAETTRTAPWLVDEEKKKKSIDMRSPASGFEA